MASISKQLTAARAELEQRTVDLETLRKELPGYEKLLRENEATADQAKRAKVGVKELSDAKLQAMSARELLEQHESDISEAEGDVDRLTALVRELEHHEQLAALETQLMKVQQQFPGLVEKALDAVQEAFAPVFEAREKWAGLYEESRSVRHSASGGTFERHSGANTDPVAHEHNQQAHAFNQRLQAAGINVNAFAQPPSLYQQRAARVSVPASALIAHKVMTREREPADGRVNWATLLRLVTSVLQSRAAAAEGR